MFTSLFNLFSENNKKGTNLDLKQGKAFEKYENDVKINTFERLPYLELTSMPGLLSINEAFNGDDSVVAKNKHFTSQLTQNESDFNKSLSEYSTLQKNLVSGAFHHNVDENSNNQIMSRLGELNKDLVDQAKKISADMANLQVDDDSIKEYIKKQRTNLNDYIQTLDANNANINNANINNANINNANNANGMSENSKLIRTSNQYYYLMWIIVLITIISLFLYILTSDLVTNTLSVIIMLMVIFLLARAIHNPNLLKKG
jgi:hypothetical protein